MNKSLIHDLICAAYEVQKQSYSPYSHFETGAALQTAKGTIYRGCNVENAAYSPTMCAERNAIFKAVSEGERDFVRIAIVGNHHGQAGDYCAPCGVCRQVMAEFCDPEQFEIILAKSPEDYKVFLLKELLPLSFSPSDLLSE